MTKLATVLATLIMALPAAAQGAPDMDAIQQPPPPPKNRPPAPILDVTQDGATEASVTVTWLAPVDPDDLMRPQAEYDVRILNLAPSSFGSDDEWFAAAKVMDGEPLPSEPGTQEWMTIAGLVEGTDYWVAIKSTDGSAWSGISNVAPVATTSKTFPPGPTDPEPSTGPASTTHATGGANPGCGNSAGGRLGLAAAALVAGLALAGRR